ncbi:tyrosine-type recombinase/integrase, partial [Jeotgalibaca caeni]|uniref:tyrosine-type recombinase/integrase n=1 Tax=Jeotgalibaca caeni TaxID=3028623 RepID=UPI00237ED408
SEKNFRRKGVYFFFAILCRNVLQNTTINNRLKVLCERVQIPVITIHSLRHTHASLLLFAGVSIASVAKRLGHSSMTTTQETYLHIIQELENQDNDKIIRHLAILI